MHSTTEKAEYIMIRTVTYYRKIVSSVALSNESAFSPCVALNLMKHLFLAHLMNRLWLFLCLLLCEGYRQRTHTGATAKRICDISFIDACQLTSVFIHSKAVRRRLWRLSRSRSRQQINYFPKYIHQPISKRKPGMLKYGWMLHGHTSDLLLLMFLI